jgi:hypothetical protein
MISLLRFSDAPVYHPFRPCRSSERLPEENIAQANSPKDPEEFGPQAAQTLE